MLYPPTSTVRRSCAVNHLDPTTAFAVVIGPPEHPNLFGCRADQPAAEKLAERVRQMGSVPHIYPVADLLAERKG